MKALHCGRFTVSLILYQPISSIVFIDVSNVFDRFATNHARGQQKLRGYSDTRRGRLAATRPRSAAGNCTSSDLMVPIGPFLRVTFNTQLVQESLSVKWGYPEEEGASSGMS